MSDLLLELGLEEIPARFVASLVLDLEKQIKLSFQKRGIQVSETKTFSSPRRLALVCKNIPEKKLGQKKLVKGPALSLAVDEKGVPQAVGLGFAKKNKLSFEQLIQKDGYLWCELNEPEQGTLELLPDIISEAVSKMYMPIAMRWSEGTHLFIRPLHWLVCLWDKQVVPLELLGIKAGRKTRGHRFLSPAEFEIPTALSYESQLAENYVLVDFEKRKVKIEKALSALHAAIDETLLSEVSYLAEWPDLLLNQFEPKYLTLPQECLIATMKKNQKYFPVLNAGKLTEKFCMVIDGLTPQNQENILNGNKRVLTARLEDARFVFQEDLKSSLQQMAQKTEGIIYQQKLGSMKDKTERMLQIAQWLSNTLQLDAPTKNSLIESIPYLKADLSSQMVREFPNLQGLMGEQYALHSKINPQIATAIREHYLPRFSGDALPQTELGSLAAFCDKAETWLACFWAGLIPTGSGDPYALRRGILGWIQIIIKNRISFSMQEFLNLGIKMFPSQQTWIEKCLPFLWERFEQSLKSEGYEIDWIRAVIHNRSDSILYKKDCLILLTDPSKREAIQLILSSAIRVQRIIKDQDDYRELKLTLSDPIEIKINETLSPDNSREPDLPALILKLKTLSVYVNEFFEKTLVMDKDLQIRQQRIALLQKTHDAYLALAAFDRIQQTD